MALTDEGLLRVEGMASHWVRLPGGAKAHYMTAGEDGPAVVLLHGGIIGSSGTAGYQFMAPFLGENGFRVYCPDSPAFGLTEDPLNFYERGLAGHVDFLHDFTTALGLDQFHLGGNSMGCNNSVNYAVAHPERVLSLLLIAGGIGDIVSNEEQRAVLEKANHVFPNINIFDGSKASMQAMLEAIVYKVEAISDDLLEMRTRAANAHREEYAEHFAKIVAGPSVSEAVKLSTKGRFEVLQIPGIYLYGRQDVLLPVEVGYLQEDRCPNLQFFYPDECGHQGQTDQPDLFNQVFLEFLRDGQVSRKTADRAGVSTRRPEIADYVAAS